MELKNIKRWVVAEVFCLMQLNPFGLAVADDSVSETAVRNPAPPSSTLPPGKTIKINPQTLRTMILDGNNTVLTELNSIYMSKDNVNIARANLLPSLNLNTMLSSSGFSLSTVSFLLPFLVPSNWFNLDQTEKLLEAEKDAYYILELNVYASAYATYQLIIGDMALRNAYYDNYLVLKNISDTLQRENEDLGTVKTSDLVQAKGQEDLAFGQVSQLDELIIQEKAALRQALGLRAGYEKSLDFDLQNAPQSKYEYYPLQSILDIAQAVAPEKKQIQHLIEAAEAAKWSTMFAFLGGGGSTLSTTAGAGQPISFSNITGNYSFKLTFATFPAMDLSNDNIAQLGLRSDEILIEQRATIEATVGSIVEAKKQLDLANHAYDQYTQLYEIEYQKYGFGLSDLLHVFNAQAGRLSAAVARVKSQMDLNSLRTSLHRVTLADEFSAIKGCVLDKSAVDSSDDGGGIFDWFKEIFDPSINKTKINAACRGKQKV